HGQPAADRTPEGKPDRRPDRSDGSAPRPEPGRRPGRGPDLGPERFPKPGAARSDPGPGTQGPAGRSASAGSDSVARHRAPPVGGIVVIPRPEARPRRPGFFFFAAPKSRPAKVENPASWSHTTGTPPLRALSRRANLARRRFFRRRW